MLAEIFDPDCKLVETIEAEPRCGDFCDGCGDCLHCYDWDGCDHRWVLYTDVHAERIAELRARPATPTTEEP